MRDEQCRLLKFGRQRLELILELQADERIQRRERLVHQQDFRIGSQGPRDAHALLHAAGQFLRKAVLVADQSDQFQCVVGDRPAPGFRNAPDFERVGHIFTHGPMREQGDVLEHHAEMQRAQFPQFRSRHPADVAAKNLDFSFGGFNQAVDQAHQGRFSRAGKTHDAENLAFRHFEACVAHADHARVFRKDFGLADGLRLRGLQRFLRASPEHLPDAFQLYDCIGIVHLMRHFKSNASRPDRSGRDAWRTYWLSQLMTKSSFSATHRFANSALSSLSITTA